MAPASPNTTRGHLWEMAPPSPNTTRGHLWEIAPVPILQLLVTVCATTWGLTPFDNCDVVGLALTFAMQ